MQRSDDYTVLPCGCVFDESRGVYERRCMRCQRYQMLQQLRAAAEECERLARALELWQLMPYVHELRKRI